MHSVPSALLQHLHLYPAIEVAQLSQWDILFVMWIIVKFVQEDLIIVQSVQVDIVFQKIGQYARKIVVKEIVNYVTSFKIFVSFVQMAIFKINYLVLIVFLWKEIIHAKLKGVHYVVLQTLVKNALSFTN